MISRWLYASILGLLLTACGGSSGDSDPQADSGGGARPPVTDSPSDGDPSPSPGNPQPPSSGGDGSNDGGDGSEAPSPDPAPAPEPQPEPRPPSSGGEDNGSGDSGGSDGGSATPPEGPLTDIRFTNPTDIASDANGNLYVVDGGDYSGQIRQIAPDGSVNTLVTEDGLTITALAVTPDGEVFYSKAENPYERVGAIWRIENGTPVQVTSEEVAMSDMVFDPSSGNLYVGVWTPDGPEVRLVEPDGSMTTLFSIDEASGAPAAMTVHNGVLWLGWSDGPYPWKYFRWSSEKGLEEIPLAIEHAAGMEATDSGVYIAGYDINKFPSAPSSCTVELLDPDTLELTRIAGGEEDSCVFGTGYQSNMTQASDGNLYLTEYFYHTIRKITPSGEVSNYAGVRNMPSSN